ncbi:Ig-like domain repeat protein [Pantoea dispersa]|uniref:Ig-like domain-containing protein n=1 Tax=Pantoea dispersa TaxID=59814 RepID=UPI001BAD31CC|nr:Ig-like domain-containing protein [Pantoea dispersa]MBS0904948.1 Ig-like domain repeat protein [Pantoea dispersa]
MSVTQYDPISAGQTSYSNTPYQYWKGHVSDSRLKTIEFSLNNRTFQVEIGRDGNWELQLPLRLEEGTHNLAVRYISHSGIYGEVLQRHIKVDFSPPDKPVITAVLDDVGSVQGPVAPGGFTDDEKPTITGFAEPDSIVRVYSNGEFIGSVQAAKNGSWQLDAPLGKGLHNVYVTASDNYNQVSEPSDIYPLRINVPLVEQPILLSVTDNEGRKQGAIAHNGQTDDKTPQLSGVAPLDAIQVNIYVNGRFVAGVPVHDGKWSWTSGYPILNDGSNVITLRAQNIRGEVSEETPPFNVFVAPDPIEAPAILKAVDDFGSIQGDLKSGGLTDDRTPTLKGKGVPGAVVEVEYGQASGSWKVAGSAVVDANGNWKLTSPQLIQDGTWEYRARSVNGASKSDWTGKFIINLDSTAPGLPIITGAYDNEGALKLIADQSVTKDKTPELRGTAEPNSKLILVLAFNSEGWEGKNKTYEVMTDSNGNWTVKIPDELADGRWHFRAKSVDAAGNTTGLSTQYYFDVISKPVISHAVDNAGSVQGDVMHGGITDDKTPTLKGKGVPNAVIEFEYGKSGEAWKAAGSAVADANGNWSFTSPALGSDGTWEYRARSVNGAGKGSWTNKFTLNVTPYAEIPAIDSAADNFGAVTGTLKDGALTDDFTPTLKGKAMASTLVYLHTTVVGGGWVSLGSVMTDKNGNWTFESRALAGGNGEYHFQASYTAARNTAAPVFKLNIHATADKAPEITHASDNVGAVQGNIKSGGITDDKTPTLHGKGTAGAVIQVMYCWSGTSNWIVAGSAVVDANGNWHFTSPDLKADGSVYFVARSVNGAKVSDWTDYFTVRMYASADKAPEITHAVDDAGAVQGDVKHGGITDDKTPTLKGKSVPGAVIEFEYGKYAEAWKAAGSVVADANGNWSFTSPILGSDGTWEYRARSVNGANKSSWTGKFVINLDTTPPAEPVITGAYDNEGSLKLIADKGIAKDKTPELRGKAEPNSKLILVLAFNSEGWEGKNKTYEVMTDAKGNWTVKIPDELADGRWHFRAKSVDAAGNTTGLSSQYYFDVIAAPMITHASDNAGAVQGNVKHFGITDDKTPTLKGKGVPGAIIEVIFGLSTDGWSSAGSTKVDANGNWSLTSPNLAKDGVWEYRARSVLDSKTSAYSEKFILNVVTGADDKKGYQWNFNDGTLQGWTAAGKYAKNGDLEVKNWSGKSGAKELGSFTNDKTTSGYNGDVVYRYIAVEKGQIYEVSFDTWRSFNDAVGFPRLGMHIDGQAAIPQSTHNSGWKHSTGYYIATETKVVKVAVTNGTATGVGNDFAIDNITIKPLANTGSESFDRSPNGTSTAFDFALNTQYTLKSGLRMKMQKAATDNMKVSIHDGYAELSRGSEVKLTFTNPTSIAKMHMGYVHKPGSKVNFYDTEGKLLYTKDLPYNGSAQNDFTFDYKAPAGKLIGSALVVVAPGETTITGAPGGVRLYDMDWQKPATTSSFGMMSFGEDPVTLTGDEEHIELSALLAQQNAQGRVDISGNGSNTLSVDVASLLQHGETSLFIDDGKTQMLIKGDSNDTIKLSDILPSGEKEGSWSQQTGQITVGGVAYNVYSHSSTDAELLVQQGVKTELV